METERSQKEMLHVGRPNLGDVDVFKQLVDQIFENRWFTNSGELVREFETRLCEYLGVRNCIPVCNGTVGLQIAAHALGLTGEVILPAFTFVATAHALQWEGIKPVFCDINVDNHDIDPSKIDSLITDRTSAIMGVHIWGRPCNTDAIQEIADRRDLIVMYDAAHAFGCKQQGQMIGNFGRCEVFSFHATKFFNTFEGGAIATNDDELAAKIRLMKNFGFARMDEVIHLGTNGKMPEICAAMGLACFEKLDEVVSTNRRNFEEYRQGLDGIPGIRLISFDEIEMANWQYVVIEVDQGRTGVSRYDLMQHLHKNSVRARRYFYPGCHRMEPYCSLYPDQTSVLPRTDELCDRVLELPTGSAISIADVNYVCEVIRQHVPGTSS